MPARTPLLTSVAVIVAAVVYVAVFGGGAPWLIAAVSFGLSMNATYAWLGHRDRPVDSGSLRRVDDVYRWIVLHGSPVMAALIAEAVSRSGRESLGWALDAASAACSERSVYPTLRFRSRRSRPISDDTLMAWMWLTHRRDLHTAAAILFASAEAHLVPDALSARQFELLTRPVNAAFALTTSPSDLSANSLTWI